MRQYLDLCQKILDHGQARGDRTGTGTISLFGERLEFDLRHGFPLVTTKRVPMRLVIAELLWFIKGGRNVNELHASDCHIWDEWAKPDGDLGPIYGVQWRSWTGANGVTYDQLSDVLARIKAKPMDRRLIVSAWNVAEIDRMALPPCHMLFQFYVGCDGTLSLQMYQRSADMFLGVPFNIASYALLLAMVARECGLTPARLIIVFGDCHVYNNHVDVVKQQLQREPRQLPELRLDDHIKHVIDFTAPNIEICGYQPWPRLKGDISV